MRKLIRTGTFRRDVKRIQRQGQNMRLLVHVFEIMKTGERIPSQYKDHALKGKWKGHRELHIESDWLLIYKIADDTVYLDRTCSRAELFSL